jgi:hypothetical protein
VVPNLAGVELGLNSQGRGVEPWLRRQEEGGFGGVGVEGWRGAGEALKRRRGDGGEAVEVNEAGRSLPPGHVGWYKGSFALSLQQLSTFLQSLHRLALLSIVRPHPSIIVASSSTCALS